MTQPNPNRTTPRCPVCDLHVRQGFVAYRDAADFCPDNWPAYDPVPNPGHLAGMHHRRTLPKAHSRFSR